MPLSTDGYEVLTDAFSGDLKDVGKDLAERRNLLCHYTSAENALNILQGKQFWLRNANCMNDYSEVINGTELIAKLLGESDNTLLQRLLSAIGDDLVDESSRFQMAWNNWIHSESMQVYIGCLSLCAPDEIRGKLSMWRAYGSSVGGVCFIFNTTPFVAETNELGVFSMPVSYFDEAACRSWLVNAIETLEKNSTAISGIPNPDLIQQVLNLLVFRAVSLKHPGFVEEEEFRLLNLSDYPTSQYVAQEVESVGGVPQIVKKVSLADDPKNGLHGADVKSLIHRVIIGPSNYPEAVSRAIVQQLEHLDVNNASDKVVHSGIPLRLSR